MNHTKKEKIAREFNAVIRSLVLKIEKKSRNDDEIANLDRLNKRISVAKQTMGEEALIEIAAPIIIQYEEHITANNDKFFTEMDIRSEFLRNMGEIKKSDEFIFDMVESVKKHYLKSRDAEKKEVIAEVNSLLMYSAQYLMEDSS
jgi:hypothetical protein